MRKVFAILVHLPYIIISGITGVCWTLPTSVCNTRIMSWYGDFPGYRCYTVKFRTFTLVYVFTIKHCYIIISGITGVCWTLPTSVCNTRIMSWYGDFPGYRCYTVKFRTFTLVYVFTIKQCYIITGITGVCRTLPASVCDTRIMSWYGDFPGYRCYTVKFRTFTLVYVFTIKQCYIITGITGVCRTLPASVCDTRIMSWYGDFPGYRCYTFRLSGSKKSELKENHHGKYRRYECKVSCVITRVDTYFI